MSQVGHKAILDGKIVKRCDDLLAWAKWFECANRHVAKDEKKGVRVSTVFLGLNHGFGDAPLWFETMIFGGAHDQFQERYSTWEEAESGHARAKKLAFEQELGE